MGRNPGWRPPAPSSTPRAEAQAWPRSLPRAEWALALSSVITRFKRVTQPTGNDQRWFVVRARAAGCPGQPGHDGEEEERERRSARAGRTAARYTGRPTSWAAGGRDGRQADVLAQPVGDGRAPRRWRRLGRSRHWRSSCRWHASRGDGPPAADRCAAAGHGCKAIVEIEGHVVFRTRVGARLLWSMERTADRPLRPDARTRQAETERIMAMGGWSARGPGGLSPAHAAQNSHAREGAMSRVMCLLRLVLREPR